MDVNSLLKTVTNISVSLLPTPTIPILTKTYTKKKIPASVKLASWAHWIGLAVGETKCLCCNLITIQQGNFEAGHIIAESNGGSTTKENLKPICSKCNKSMGSRNMNDFIAEFHTKQTIKQSVNIVVRIRRCNGCLNDVPVEVPILQSVYNFKCPRCSYTETTNSF
jgi:hypothetical protein